MDIKDVVGQLAKIVRVRPTKPDIWEKNQFAIDQCRHLKISQEANTGIDDVELDTLLDCILKDSSGKYLAMMKDILVLAKIEFGTEVEAEVSKYKEEWVQQKKEDERFLKNYQEKLQRWEVQHDVSYFRNLVLNTMVSVMEGHGTPEERKAILGTMTGLVGRKDWSDVSSRSDLGDGTLSRVDAFKRKISTLNLRELNSLGRHWHMKLDLE